MTKKHAASRRLQVIELEEEKKVSMYKQTIDKALDLACDQHGYIVLNKIITEADHYPHYKDKLLDVVADNALSLSKDAYGNLVVQHVINLCNKKIAVNLRGHYVDLSFHKYGSEVVSRLLETGDTSLVITVVEELVACNRTRLLRLAKNEYGKGVVSMALRVTYTAKADLFSCLVRKINPRINIDAIDTALKRKDEQLNVDDDEKETDWLQDFADLLTQNGSVLVVEEEVLNYDTGYIDPDLRALYDSVRSTKIPKHS